MLKFMIVLLLFVCSFSAQRVEYGNRIAIIDTLRNTSRVRGDAIEITPFFNSMSISVVAEDTTGGAAVGGKITFEVLMGAGTAAAAEFLGLVTIVDDLTDSIDVSSGALGTTNTTNIHFLRVNAGVTLTPVLTADGDMSSTADDVLVVLRYEIFKRPR